MNAAWWWIDRWRKSTAYTDMTAEQQGVYRNLLDELWLRKGAIPANDRILAKISGDPDAWPRVRDIVLARFILTPQGWTNPTHDEVSGQSQRRAENQKAYRDRLKADNAPNNATDNKADNKAASPSPSPSLISGTVSTNLNPSKILGNSKRETPVKSGNGNGHASRASLSGDPFLDPTITERAGRFIERYEVLYRERRKGARYAVKPHRDYAAAVTLCKTWALDDYLDKLAVVFLTTDHKFAEEGSRTIPQFLALASWCDGKLRDYADEKGITL